MPLKHQLTEDMKSAMCAGDKAKLAIVRLVLSAIKQKEVDERVDLSSDDTQILAILEKMIKQRRESIAQYEQANRTDLADQEKAEIALIQTYMPQPLSENEVDTLIDKAIAETGAKTMQDMAKVMVIIKPALLGRADMGAVSQKIRQRLGN